MIGIRLQIKNARSRDVVYDRFTMGLRCIRSHPDSFTIKAEIAIHLPRKVYNWFMLGLRALRYNRVKIAIRWKRLLWTVKISL